MDKSACKKFRPDQLDKIGNTAIYLINAIGALSKTKLLKLLYILDELSIKRSGIPLMDEVIRRFKTFSAQDLKNYTHRQGSPWYNAAIKGDVLQQLEDEEFSTTDIIIDMSQLVADDQRKQGIYQDYIEAF